LNIDIAICEDSRGQVKVIGSIEDPKMIELILKTPQAASDQD
tara:strand:- start:793 stop:918 length:126 start_codon:yes stop_codon:yes gene_type:complete